VSCFLLIFFFFNKLTFSSVLDIVCSLAPTTFIILYWYSASCKGPPEMSLLLMLSKGISILFYTDCILLRLLILEEFVPLWRNIPTRARDVSFFNFLDHTQWYTTVGTTPLDERSARRKNPCNTQQSKEADIYTPSGIRTRNPSKQSDADPHLRPLGQ
jgi:hypothetical protein